MMLLTLVVVFLHQSENDEYSITFKYKTVFFVVAVGHALEEGHGP